MGTETRAWKEGYVTELEYTHGFYRELAPVHLSLCLLQSGRQGPNFDEPFTYCELGCGQGFSTSLLAAVAPHGQFHGVDFNPQHAVNARQLARTAGLDNVQFHHCSFADLGDRDWPEFDAIVLHGVYSWISPDNQRAIARFLGDRLAPGGLAYVSYNLLPGWAPLMPLQKLLWAWVAESGGPIARRFDEAVQFVRQAIDCDARYFQAHPAAAEFFRKLEGKNRQYLVHEYLNQHWQPQYYADVAAMLAPAQLQFVTAANLLERADLLQFKDEQRQALAAATDPILRETLRDTFSNSTFRRDIFAKGAIALLGLDRQQQLLETRFALAVSRDRVKLEHVFPVGQVNLQPEIYQPVLDRLETGPTTGEKLLREAPNLTANNLDQALTLLAGLSYIAPCPRAVASAERVRAFNRAACQFARHSDDRPALASPLLGNGVEANRLERLFWLANDRGAEPVGFAWETLKQLGQRLVRDGQTLETDEENRAHLQSSWESFDRDRRPLFERLGIW